MDVELEFPAAAINWVAEGRGADVHPRYRRSLQSHWPAAGPRDLLAMAARAAGAGTRT